MTGRLPPLHTLEAFELAARSGSFTLAAEALHRTPSAVSHQVKALEAHLGVTLFRRLNRALELTPDGRQYLAIVEAALTQLRDGSAHLQARSHRARLAISMGPFLAGDFIVPALPAFQALHPEIDLTIDTDLRIKHLQRDRYDLALRFGRGDWPDAVAVPLLRVAAEPVCAPSLVPGTVDAESLARLPRLQSSPMPEAWAQWAQATGTKLPPPAQALWFDSYVALLSAAEKGLGVALGLRPLVNSRIRDGRLAAPWGAAMPIPQAYFLLHRPGDDTRPEIVAFRDWLQQLLKFD